MKREILFRAKQLDGGPWIEGYLFETKERAFIIQNLLSHIEVEPKTVSQYANCKLAKGQKLFENMIVFREYETRRGDYRIYKICVWIDGLNLFSLLSWSEYNDYLNDARKFLDDSWHADMIMDMDICSNYHHAGNIFDNPELLHLGDTEWDVVFADDEDPDDDSDDDPFEDSDDESDDY